MGYLELWKSNAKLSGLVSLAIIFNQCQNDKTNLTLFTLTKLFL